MSVSVGNLMNVCEPHDWPDAGEGACCMGAAVYGPERCTCWEPVYDLDQKKPRPGTEPEPIRLSMCEDCAYRPGSPERRGDEQAAGDQQLLDEIVEKAEPFWCHQGIRRPLKWVHPSGAEVPGSALAYAPPIIDNTPYRADGRPAQMCAGWAARVTKLHGLAKASVHDGSADA